MTYLQSYNTKNRIASITKLAGGDCATPGIYATKWDFSYDDDGTRTSTLTTPYQGVQPGTSSLTSYFFGRAYETHNDGTNIKHPSFTGQTAAIGDGTGHNISSPTTSLCGCYHRQQRALRNQQRHLLFGRVRIDMPSPDSPDMDYGYTDQRNLDANIGLMDYKARFYWPCLNINIFFLLEKTRVRLILT